MCARRPVASERHSPKARRRRQPWSHRAVVASFDPRFTVPAVQWRCHSGVTGCMLTLVPNSRAGVALVSNQVSTRLCYRGAGDRSYSRYCAELPPPAWVTLHIARVTPRADELCRSCRGDQLALTTPTVMRDVQREPQDLKKGRTEATHACKPEGPSMGAGTDTGTGAGAGAAATAASDVWVCGNRNGGRYGPRWARRVRDARQNPDAADNHGRVLQ